MDCTHLFFKINIRYIPITNHNHIPLSKLSRSIIQILRYHFLIPNNKFQSQIPRNNPTNHNIQYDVTYEKLKLYYVLLTKAFVINYRILGNCCPCSRQKLQSIFLHLYLNECFTTLTTMVSKFIIKVLS